MRRRTDNLDRELKRLDPVGPGELDRALETHTAEALLERILAMDGEVAAPTAPARRPRRLAALTLVPAAAIAAVVLLFVTLGGSGGGAGERDAAPALDSVAAVAATRQEMTAETTYTFMKTREVTLVEGSAGRRSWAVHEPTVREEWVAGDGSGRVRTVAGPARFLDSREHAEWEAAGSPEFLPLGLERRTEDRWLAAGLLAADLEELPTEPVALAAQLRGEAAAGPGDAPLPAAMLTLIATDLRNPGASPELRQALFLATKRVPGIALLGERTDPDGRRGLAVGVTDPHGAGGPELYSLIFDPTTATVLASEVSSAGAGGGTSSPLRQAVVYLDSGPVASGSNFGRAWLSAYDSSAPWQRSESAYLVYHVPSRDPWLRTLGEGMEVR